MACPQARHTRGSAEPQCSQNLLPSFRLALQLGHCMVAPPSAWGKPSISRCQTGQTGNGNGHPPMSALWHSVGLLDPLINVACWHELTVDCAAAIPSAIWGTFDVPASLAARVLLTRRGTQPERAGVSKADLQARTSWSPAATPTGYASNRFVYRSSDTPMPNNAIYCRHLLRGRRL